MPREKDFAGASRAVKKTKTAVAHGCSE